MSMLLAVHKAAVDRAEMTSAEIYHTPAIARSAAKRPGHPVARVAKQKVNSPCEYLSGYRILCDSAAIPIDNIVFARATPTSA
ncbi:hypothetical protein FHT86_003122 [Rhizobium sp. BK313]|jgi:hypothetical protein|nr:hypothetical protein [Rhizobium sp. BK313]